MTRTVYISNFDGGAEACQKRIQSISEERLHFIKFTNEELVKYEFTKDANENNLMFFVPYFNQYQGLALYVPSRFQPQLDVDLFFSKKIFEDLGSIVYFIKHDAWLFDCGSPEVTRLEPFYLSKTPIEIIKQETKIQIVDTI